MPFSIDPVSAVGATSAATPSARLDEAGASARADGFGSALTGALENLQSMQSTSDELAIKAVTGDLTDIHQATLASTRAQVTLELVATLRNKGVDAFNEIMRMQA